MLLGYKLFISDTGKILSLKDIENSTVVGSISYDIDERKDFSTLHNLNINYSFRRKGFAKKLRNEAIKRILDLKITKIHTNPQSYSKELKLEDLASFYRKNFKEMGSSKIEERVLYQGRLEIVAFF